MCEPIIGSVIGIAVSLASAAMQAQAQNNLINAQNEANQQWVAYQRQKSQEEWSRQEQMRQRAENARQQTLAEMTPEKQKEAQTTEEQRVQQDITPEALKQTDEQLVGDRLLSGQQYADPTVKEAISSKITGAARDARSRIAALATMQSYGGSQFGLQPRSKQTFAQGGQDIGLSGVLRQGSLGAYGVEKAVQPRQFSLGSGGGSGMGSIATSLASIAGKGFAGSA